jgi:hypothetical protein
LAEKKLCKNSKGEHSGVYSLPERGKPHGVKMNHDGESVDLVAAHHGTAYSLKSPCILKQVLAKNERKGVLAVTTKEVAGYEKNVMIYIENVELSYHWEHQNSCDGCLYKNVIAIGDRYRGLHLKEKSL